MANPEDFTRLHERALEFVGSFASLQLMSDSVIDLYLSKKLPDLGPAVISAGLKRRRDEDRLKLVGALARESDYSQVEAFASIYSAVFNRCKQLRDLIGHAVSIVGPVHGLGMPLHVGIARLPGTKIDKLPDPLPPSHFDRFKDQAEWLADHVHRIAYEADIMTFMTPGGEQFEPPMPASLPHPNV